MMNRTALFLLLAVACVRPFGFAEPAPASSTPNVTKLREVPDPRSVKYPHLLFHNQKNAKYGVQGALLVYARWDIQPPNQILGVEGSFTDEQIIAGIRKFYREWRAPAADPSQPHPALILATQNWGSGHAL